MHENSLVALFSPWRLLKCIHLYHPSWFSSWRRVMRWRHPEFPLWCASQLTIANLRARKIVVMTNAYKIDKHTVEIKRILVEFLSFLGASLSLPRVWICSSRSTRLWQSLMTIQIRVRIQCVPFYNAWFMSNPSSPVDDCGKGKDFHAPPSKTAKACWFICNAFVLK